MVTKAAKQKKPDPIKEYPWLNDLGGVGNWMGLNCIAFLKDHPSLSKDDPRIKKIKLLSLEKRMNLEAKLERSEDEARTSIERSYAAGAIKAFAEKDYRCPLLYRYIASRELEEFQ